MSPTIEKSHVNDISYKAYMGKIVICRTLAMSIYHHYSFVFMHGHHAYVYMYIVQECLRIQDSPQYMCTKNLVSRDQPILLVFSPTFLSGNSFF